MSVLQQAQLRIHHEGISSVQGRGGGATAQLALPHDGNLWRRAGGHPAVRPATREPPRASGAGAARGADSRRRHPRRGPRESRPGPIPAGPRGRRASAPAAAGRMPRALAPVSMRQGSLPSFPGYSCVCSPVCVSFGTLTEGDHTPPHPASPGDAHSASPPPPHPASPGDAHSASPTPPHPASPGDAHSASPPPRDHRRLKPQGRDQRLKALPCREGAETASA